MQLGPRFHEALLAPRKRSSDQFYWVEAEEGHIILVMRMEMWPVVRHADFHIHPNNNAKETTKFRHFSIVSHGGIWRFQPCFSVVSDSPNKLGWTSRWRSFKRLRMRVASVFK